MSEIFVARPRSTASVAAPVALKRLWPELARHPEVRAAFEREACLLGTLSHPGVPRLIDRGEQGPYRYIVMELVRGPSLGRLWERSAGAGERVAGDVICAIGLQLCAVLEHVHGRVEPSGRSLGIVHCDVTPQNVLLTPEGSVKLVDFGVARTASHHGPPGPIRGTVAYMAPEQVEGRAVDARTDLYGVGALMYELMTGTRLRTGSEVDMMIQAVEHEAALPSGGIEGYPQALRALVNACLSRDPSQRPATAASLAARIRRLAEEHGWASTPTALGAWVERWERRGGTPC